MSRVGVTITERQDQVLGFIGRHTAAKGQPPTRAEIAREFGFRSTNAAECVLRSLQSKGFITLLPKVRRGIRMSAP